MDISREYNGIGTISRRCDQLCNDGSSWVGNCLNKAKGRKKRKLLGEKHFKITFLWSKLRRSDFTSSLSHVFCKRHHILYQDRLWAFYFVPWIYISAFVPVPYHLDDCVFVVEPEFRQVDSSCSILLSQDRFGYSRFFGISIQIVKLFVLALWRILLVAW